MRYQPRAHMTKPTKTAAPAQNTTPKDRGVVKLWNPEKGFGFITADIIGQSDVFLHISEWQKTTAFRSNTALVPVSGMKLAYRTAPPKGTGKNLQAIEVELVDV